MTAIRPSFVPIVAVFALTLTLGACTKPSPTGPPPPPTATTGLLGTWSGDVSDSSGSGQMTWQIAKDAPSFAGLLFIVESNGGYGGAGSVTGTVSGSTLHFTLGIPAGGFEGPFNACTAELTGDAQFTSSITGSYTGTSSCGGAITDGQFTLTRQP